MEPSLISLEKLDRSSPDLWPEQIPGVYNFTPLVSPHTTPERNKLNGFSDSDFSLLYQLGRLKSGEIIEEVKKLQTVAYELGVEEAKEMTRGKYLHVFHEFEKSNF